VWDLLIKPLKNPIASFNIYNCRYKIHELSCLLVVYYGCNCTICDWLLCTQNQHFFTRNWRLLASHSVLLYYRTEVDSHYKLIPMKKDSYLFHEAILQSLSFNKTSVGTTIGLIMHWSLISIASAENNI